MTSVRRTTGPTKTNTAIAKGRDAYTRRDWDDAYQLLSGADERAALAVGDLEMMAWSAALIGRNDMFLQTQERLYKIRLGADEVFLAARSAFWSAMRLFELGEPAQAGAWVSRAARLIEGRDCVEQGYLLLPVAYRHLGAGEFGTAAATAADAAAIGDSHRDADLSTLARNVGGRALLRHGEIARGLALLDEAMLSAASDDVSPVVTGLVYCSVIDGCQQVFALARSREWTSVLAEWCDRQPQLVTFTGICHVHRAEIMALGGDWENAVTEADRAAERSVRTTDLDSTIAAARYQRAEVHRLRGEFVSAEAAYRSASQFGGEPQPGLALMRLAQGQESASATAIERVYGATDDRLERARLLPAFIEIMVATGALAKAEAGYRDLEKIAAAMDSEVLNIIAAHAQGSILLARGDPASAVGPLRTAFAAWHQFGAPYLAARLRVLVGLACRALGDSDACALEFDAARAVFKQLGAAPDLDRLADLAGTTRHDGTHGLTRREMQVLQHVAAGKTNRKIAQELSISEKTVDRHVSNIFVKLDVPTRTAAAAFAYEHSLIGHSAAG